MSGPKEEIPPNVRLALIQHRLDALATPERQLLLLLIEEGSGGILEDALAAKMPPVMPRKLIRDDLAIIQKGFLAFGDLVITDGPTVKRWVLLADGDTYLQLLGFLDRPDHFRTLLYAQVESRHTPTDPPDTTLEPAPTGEAKP